MSAAATEAPVGTCPHGVLMTADCQDCYEDYLSQDEGPTCGLCDAVGHGYPGGGPCPLEERGWMDSLIDEQMGGGW
jgi:hypothetical protein